MSGVKACLYDIVQTQGRGYEPRTCIAFEVWWGELGSDIQYRAHAVRLWVVWRPHMGDRCLLVAVHLEMRCFS